MIGVWNGLRALAGDALIAAGTTLHDRRSAFDEFVAGEYLLSGRMECDGPDSADALCECGHWIHDSNVCTACGCLGLRARLTVPEREFLETSAVTPPASPAGSPLPTSQLLSRAADTIIVSVATVAVLVDSQRGFPDVDAFVTELRHRAAQLAAHGK